MSPDNLIYIGSTISSLSVRFQNHRSAYRAWKDGKQRNTTVFTLFEEHGVDNCKIELIENYRCSSKKELDRREGEIILNTECINKIIPGRTSKEYREANKVILKEKFKQFYEENREKQCERVKKYAFENKEQVLIRVKLYNQKNKQVITERKRKYREENAEKIREQKRLYRQANRDKINKQKKEYRKRIKNTLSK